MRPESAVIIIVSFAVWLASTALLWRWSVHGRAAWLPVQPSEHWRAIAAGHPPDAFARRMTRSLARMILACAGGGVLLGVTLDLPSVRSASSAGQWGTWAAVLGGWCLLVTTLGVVSDTRRRRRVQRRFGRPARANGTPDRSVALTAARVVSACSATATVSAVVFAVLVVS